MGYMGYMGHVGEGGVGTKLYMCYVMAIFLEPSEASRRVGR